MNAQQIKATELLAKLLILVGADYPDAEGIGVGEVEDLETGVRAQLHLPTGDVYEVVVNWLGDRESAE